MNKLLIRLKSVGDIQEFVKIASQFSFGIDITNNDFTANAKSIMGVLTLDLSKPLEVVAHDDDCESTFIAEISKFAYN